MIIKKHENEKLYSILSVYLLQLQLNSRNKSHELYWFIAFRRLIYRSSDKREFFPPATHDN